MSTVKKAVVLAAGRGTRLRPFTCATPKPLLPVWGEPMLARMVAFLRELGVEEIVVNCHYLHEQVEAWCAANGCRASYEPEILGTGGVLNPLREWIGNDDFYLVNGDIVIENFVGFKHFKGFNDETVAWALTTEEGPRTIEVEPESGYVTNWKSDDAGYPGTFTYCGFAVLSHRILDYVAPTGFSSIVQAYEKAMMDGRFVKAVMPKDLLWEDAGTIQKLIDVNRDGDDNAFADFPQLKATGANDFKFLGARGSERVFFDSDKGVVVVYDDTTRTENGLYAGHSRWLKAQGVPVPEVVFDDPSIKTMVLEHAGCEKRMSVDEYAEVVKALVRFNGLLGDAAGGDAPRYGADSAPGSVQRDGAASAPGAVPRWAPARGAVPQLLPPFDDEAWKWERDLFAKYCLGKRFGLEMPKDVEAELEKVAEILEKEPKSLVHRDFQSTNILWKNGKPTFIDFQGMRLGPAAYDLASLVYDPYVTFTDKAREALVALYAKEAGRPEIVKVLPFAAVQRLVQCLGAYGRLASVGQPQFGKHVLPALVNLLDAADAAGLDALGALAEDLIAREKKQTEKKSVKHDALCTCGHCHE